MSTKIIVTIEARPWCGILLWPVKILIQNFLSRYSYKLSPTRNYNISQQLYYKIAKYKYHNFKFCSEIYNVCHNTSGALTWMLIKQCLPLRPSPIVELMNKKTVLLHDRKRRTAHLRNKPSLSCGGGGGGGRRRYPYHIREGVPHPGGWGVGCYSCPVTGLAPKAGPVTGLPNPLLRQDQWEVYPTPRGHWLENGPETMGYPHPLCWQTPVRTQSFPHTSECGR